MATANYLGKIHWVPKIGDPTIIGWVTVAAYFIVALICFRAVFLSQDDKSVKHFWLYLTFFLVALGINKQFDLQTLLVITSRDLAFEQGWYEGRRIVQTIFILLISFLSIIGLNTLLKKYKNTRMEIKVALISSTILLIFVLARALSFHYIDTFINIKLIGVKINVLLELASLITICASNFKYIMHKKS